MSAFRQSCRVALAVWPPSVVAGVVTAAIYGCSSASEAARIGVFFGFVNVCWLSIFVPVMYSVGGWGARP